MLDPLGVVTKTRSAIEEEEASMAEAPSTITHNQEMLNPMADDLTYRPVMADLPDIAVPGNLPNLPGNNFRESLTQIVCKCQLKAICYMKKNFHKAEIYLMITAACRRGECL